MKNYKRGFVIPVLIIIIALLALGGGAYFYLKNSETNSAHTSTANNSEGNTQTLDYFEIRELGIKLKLSQDIKDLTYIISPDNNKVALFSTKSLKLTARNYCAASYGPLGIISIDQQNLSVRGELPAKESDTFRNINGQWVYYVHPQATCSDNKESQDLAIRQISALQDAFKTVEATTQVVADISEWKRYTDTQYKFSFQYPSVQSSTFHVLPPYDDTIFGPRLRGYEFVYGPNGSISLSIISKDAFHGQTKVGDITFKNGCWYDAGVKRSSMYSKVAGSYTLYQVGGSQMSDPAHNEFALVTSSSYIIVIQSTYINTLQDTALEDTAKSIQFQSGIQGIQVDCL